MKKNTILHKIGQLIVPLKRTMSPFEADSHSACGGHFFNRSLLLMLLMLTLGINVSWGQDTDYSGTYYIGSKATKQNNKANSYTYNSEELANNYYLCPTEGWYFYDGDNDTNNGWTETENGKPFLTTYKCLEDGKYDVSKAVWVIEKKTNTDFYYIKQKKTTANENYRYLVSNKQITGTSSARRMRVHLEEFADNETAFASLGDLALFEIATVPNDLASNCLYIMPHSANGRVNNEPYLVVNDGNYNNLKAGATKGDGPNGTYGKNTQGTIGVYSTEPNGYWTLEVPRPVISFNASNQVEITDPTGFASAIYFTTNGDDPTVDPSNLYSAAFDPDDDVTTIKAIAIVDGQESGVATFTPPFFLGSTHNYIIQSKNCKFYNMIPNVSLDDNTKYVSTLNVPCTTMAWHFEYAEEGYYYIVDANGWYMYCTTTDNTNKYIYLKSNKDESDGYKFQIASHANGGYNIIPKGQTKAIYKNNYGNNNAGLTPVKFDGTITNDVARWDLIPYSTANLPMWEDAPFNVSTDAETNYYNITSVKYNSDSDWRPLILNNDGLIKSQTIPLTEYDERKAMWVIKKVASDADGLLDFYTFQNAYTGELLYYNGARRETKDDTGPGVLQMGKPTSEGALDSWSYFAVVQTVNGYNIIPSVLVDKTKAIGTGANHEGFNCINRANGSDVTGAWYDNDDGSRWTFVEQTDVKCMEPVFTEEANGEITITSVTNGAKIRYTIDGANPTASSAEYTTKQNTSTQKVIKAIAIMGDDASTASNVVTLLNKPDITLAAGPYTYNSTAWEPEITKVSIGTAPNETEAPTSPATYSVSYTNNLNAGTATVTLEDADLGDNWYVWNASTTFTITAAEITVSGITASNKVYDGNTTATLDCTNVTLTGKVGSENVSITATGTFADKNVGEDKTVNITGLTLGGSDASNYALAASGQQATTTADITVKDITVSEITANNKVYDGTADAELVYTGVTLTGKVEGDNLAVTASGAFADENVGNNKTVTISNLTLVGEDAGNYELAASGQQTEATADITAKEITASGNITSSNKVYDGNTTATLDLANVTLTGKVDGDDIALTATGTFEDKNVGTDKAVIIGLALSGNDAGNYNLESSSIPTSITADITVKEVTASGVITANNKAYDGTTDAELVYTGVTLTGKVEGDDLTVTATGTFADKNVGTGKTVDISEWVLDGTDKDNYQLASSGQPTTTTADITVASITVSGITASNKIYDGNTTATLDFANVTLAGKVDNEDISVTATGAFADKNVGTDKNVSISDMSLLGDDIGNYVLAESGQQTTATASVTAKEITVSGFTSEDKEYDGTTTATLVYSGVTFSGMVEDDDLSVTATGAFADKNVGTGKTVTISEPTLGGEDAGNYALAEFGQQTTATASITAKEITVSGITAADRVYDGTTTATLVYTSATLAGMVEDDDLSVTATGAFADKNVDTDKTVNISGLTLSGYDAGNYVLAESGQQTEATANITPKSVTVSGVTAENKVYDGTTVATLVLEDARFAEGDIIEGDELTLESGIGAFDTKDVGTNKTVNLIFGGADAGNYALAASGQQDPITADITPAPLTITANDKSISYGDAPANDGVTFGVDDGNDGTTNTFVDGEDENVLGGTLTFSYNSQSDGLGTAYTATDIVPMGTCYIIPGGWTSTNYFITFVPGTLTIGGKSIGDGTLAAGFTISFDEDNNIILQDGSRTLTEGTDYSIDGTSTISASGRYSTRTINGTGNYGGTANIRNAIVNFTNDGNGGTVYSATFVAESATPDASPDPQKGHALPDGITAYIITAINGNTATTEALSYIPEGVPVLLLSNGYSNGFMVQDVSGQTAPTSTNLLKEVTEESKHFDVKTIYILYRNEFVYNMAGDLSKGRVYLDPTPSSPSGARLVINWGEENSIDTSILSSLASPLPDTWHSLDGRRLNGKPTKKGLYIKNGQKVVIK